MPELDTSASPSDESTLVGSDSALVVGGIVVVMSDVMPALDDEPSSVAVELTEVEGDEESPSFVAGE